MQIRWAQSRGHGGNASREHDEDLFVWVWAWARILQLATLCSRITRPPLPSSSQDRYNVSIMYYNFIQGAQCIGNLIGDHESLLHSLQTHCLCCSLSNVMPVFFIREDNQVHRNIVGRLDCALQILVYIQNFNGLPFPVTSDTLFADTRPPLPSSSQDTYNTSKLQYVFIWGAQCSRNPIGGNESPLHSLEEFADYKASITFSPSQDRYIVSNMYYNFIQGAQCSGNLIENYESLLHSLQKHCLYCPLSNVEPVSLIREDNQVHWNEWLLSFTSTIVWSARPCVIIFGPYSKSYVPAVPLSPSWIRLLQEHCLYCPFSNVEPVFLMSEDNQVMSDLFHTPTIIWPARPCAINIGPYSNPQLLAVPHHRLGLASLQPYLWCVFQWTSPRYLVLHYIILGLRSLHMWCIPGVSFLSCTT